MMRISDAAKVAEIQNPDGFLSGTGVPDAPRPCVRCREIEARDLDAVVALLGRGFPERTAGYWRQGLARHAAHQRPEGCTTWGYVMTADERIVGVILALYAPPGLPGMSGPRCNLSSWYVEPAFRLYATLLDKAAMGRRDTTFTNISAAPHTLAMHLARGFTKTASGQFAFVPLLARGRSNHAVKAAAEPGALDGLTEPERRLLTDHAACGCICLVGHDGAAATPFVFVRHPVRWLYWRLGFSPMQYLQVVYCRSSETLAAYARPLGSHLLRRHRAACVLIDADEPIEGLPGLYLRGMENRIKRGPDTARHGDLSYSEMVIFGP